MKFNKAFFENTRLSLLSKAAMVMDAVGNVMYLNKAFAKLSREEPGIGSQISGDDREASALTKNSITLFGEDMVIFIEKGSPCFPLYENRNIYFVIETAEFYIKLPLFGGRVRIIGKSEKRCNRTVEPVADMNIDYFMIDTVLERVLTNFREKSCHSGLRLEIDVIDISNMICKASVFDISLIMGLLMNAISELSSNKTVTVSAVRTKNDFVFDVSVRTDRNIKDGRSLASEIFSSDNALVSLENFCKLFSYRLMCRKKGDMLSIAIAVPVHSTVSVNFRNEDEKKLLEAADRAALLY